MEKIIYFDNAATTKICPEAAEAMKEAFNVYGNPSSLHLMGSIARNGLNKSRKTIEKIFGANEQTFYFTSGATESNNWAIFGSAYSNKRRGMHIITSQIEHPSVLEPVKYLEKNGFEVTYIPHDKNGMLDIDRLLGLIREDTILVSIMHVNNETGVINKVEEIGRRIKQINKETVFHVDHVCGFCKIPISVENIDLLSVSGHKLHSPKGVGGLYIKKGVRIAPFILGGGQQANMRSGTENTLYIQAFAAAASACAISLKENYVLAKRLKAIFTERFIKYGDTEIISGMNDSEYSPYILTVAFKGIKSQIMINALEERNIFVSAGSACSSNKSMHNKTLAALGIDKELLEGAVRLSFSKYNTVEEAYICLEAIDNIIKQYRSV